MTREDLACDPTPTNDARECLASLRDSDNNRRSAANREILPFEAKVPADAAALANTEPTPHGGEYARGGGGERSAWTGASCYNCRRSPGPTLFTNLALAVGARYGSVMCHNCSRVGFFGEGGKAARV